MRIIMSLQPHFPLKKQIRAVSVVPATIILQHLYYINRTSCYRLYEERLDFTSAQARCESSQRDGHLIELDDQV